MIGRLVFPLWASLAGSWVPRCCSEMGAGTLPSNSETRWLQGAVVPSSNTTQGAVVPSSNTTQGAVVPSSNTTQGAVVPSSNTTQGAVVPSSNTTQGAVVPSSNTTQGAVVPSSNATQGAVVPSSNATQGAVVPSSNTGNGTFDLGNLRPEGIHALPDDVSAEIFGLGSGSFALVGSLLYGGVRAINLDTGNLTDIVPEVGFGQRQILGLQYWNETILAAGGGSATYAPNVTGGIHFFDIKTGQLKITCQAPIQPALINDLTILGDTVYATNSYGANLMSVNLTALAVDGLCFIGQVTLPEMLFSSPGKIYMNGIVSYGTGVMFCLTTPGSLWWIDPASSDIKTVLPTGTIVGCDGLTLANGTDGLVNLYVTENSANRISAWSLSNGTDGFPAATLQGYIFNPAFDYPAASAVVGDNVYSVNARYDIGYPAPGEDNLTTFTETFQVVTSSLTNVGTISPTMAPTDSPTTSSPTRSPVAAIPGVAGTFDLGPYRPEGMHILPPGTATRLGLVDGPYALVSQFAFGGIDLVNLDTGHVTTLIPGASFLTRMALGVNFYEAPDGSMVVITAGGGTAVSPNVAPSVHLFNASSGLLILSCPPVGNLTTGFMNDIAIVNDTAYITNSIDSSLMTVNLTATLATGVCAPGTITLPDWFKDGNNLMCNGIVSYEDRYLLIATTTQGALYSLDLTRTSIVPLLNLGTIPNADGLTLVTNPPGSTSKATLYVNENANNRISVWSVNDGPIVESLGRSISSPGYDYPTSSGVLGDLIYTVNARFGSLPFPASGEDNPSNFTSMFQIVGLDSNSNGTGPATGAPSKNSPLSTQAPSPVLSSNVSAVPTMKPTSKSAGYSIMTRSMTMAGATLVAAYLAGI